MPKHFKRAPVVTVQAVMRADPQKPAPILQNAARRALREPLFHREMLELQITAAGRNGKNKDEARENCFGN